MLVFNQIALFLYQNKCYTILTRPKYVSILSSTMFCKAGQKPAKKLSLF